MVLMEAAIAGNVDACRQEAAITGDLAREHQLTLRQRREEQQQQWENHGRNLTEKYSTRDHTNPHRKNPDEEVPEEAAHHIPPFEAYSDRLRI